MVTARRKGVREWREVEGSKGGINGDRKKL